jgi:DNA-binding response OmpR family regulator
MRTSRVTLGAPMWSHGGVQVMVVEDYADYRDALCTMLAFESYRPMPCPTAESAWTMLVAGLRPAAIVLDLALPRMSGRELLKLVRATPWGILIPVLLLSGWHRPDEHAIDADRVLPKTAEPVSIMRAIDRLVAHGRRSASADVLQPKSDPSHRPMRPTSRRRAAASSASHSDEPGTSGKPVPFFVP